ncbi:MAG: class I SAM-dependent methyltransferase [Acutalibacteraceae bacterium]
MRYTKWNDYELLDTSEGNRLERWGDVILVRPDPQVIWKTPKNIPQWNNYNAIYHRSNKGGGAWKIKKHVPESWKVSYKNLYFNVKMMNFKHTGIFPEQAVNWDMLDAIIRKRKSSTNVLNLFAYTGGATLACANAGAKVCHVDASKGMVSWARENAEISNLKDSPIRWIVEDCEKFVLREIKRKNKYDGLIMDPPSYGRGPKGEIWRIEDNIYDFIKLCKNVLSENAEFFVINSYSTGLSASVMGYMLSDILQKNLGGYVHSDEIGIPVSSSGLVIPAGATAIWSSHKIF